LKDVKGESDRKKIKKLSYLALNQNGLEILKMQFRSKDKYEQTELTVIETDLIIDLIRWCYSLLTKRLN